MNGTDEEAIGLPISESTRKAAEEWADEIDDDAKAEPELEFTLGTELEVGSEPEFDSEPEWNPELELNSEMEGRFSSPDMTSDYLQT